MSVPVVVSSEPIISVADAKLRQIDLAGATDDVVAAAIATATTALENYTGRAIGMQTLDWYPDDADSNFRYLAYPYPLPPGAWGTCWQWGWPISYFDLPRPPLVSVTSIKYLDADHVEQTFPSTDYWVSGVGRTGRITLKSGSVWPTVGAYSDAVVIRFVAGYSVVPEPLISAVLLDAAESVAAQASGGSGAVRSESIEGVGTITYDVASVAGAKSNTLSPNARWLADSYIYYGG
jgi:hypothetical protein